MQHKAFKNYVIKCYLTGLAAGLFILFYFKLPFWVWTPSEMMHNLSHIFTFEGATAVTLACCCCYFHHKTFVKEVNQ